MIGWYVHHQGRGHLTRATTVAPHLAEPVTVLSSLPEPSDSVFADWVRLRRDDDLEDATDPTAHGVLHWAPYGSSGLAARTAQISAWVSTARPRLIVVDVSVEVTLLARLCGVPVVVVAGPGDRADAPHQTAYAVADRIVAAWPREVYDPSFLHPHSDRTVYVGAISRFDGRDRPTGTGSDVLVLSGAGGGEQTSADVARADAASRLTWTGVGLPGSVWVEDVWPQLRAASVVVTHGGQNALADISAARRPAVVVPQVRPFAEQSRVAAALHSNGLAVTLPGWPEAGEWDTIIDRTLSLGGHGWCRWSTGHGAQAAAEAIESVIR